MDAFLGYDPLSFDWFYLAIATAAVVTVCRGPQSDCKGHLFVDRDRWLKMFGWPKGEEKREDEHHGGASLQPITGYFAT